MTSIWTCFNISSKPRWFLIARRGVWAPLLSAVKSYIKPKLVKMVPPIRVSNNQQRVRISTFLYQNKVNKQIIWHILCKTMPRRLKSKSQWCSSQIAPTQTGSTTLRICAVAVIASMDATRTRGIALILIDYYTPWECARHATYPITIRERTLPESQQIILYSVRLTLRKPKNRVLIIRTSLYESALVLTNLL